MQQWYSPGSYPGVELSYSIHRADSNPVAVDLVYRPGNGDTASDSPGPHGAAGNSGSAHAANKNREE